VSSLSNTHILKQWYLLSCHLTYHLYVFLNLQIKINLLFFFFLNFNIVLLLIKFLILFLLNFSNLHHWLKFGTCFSKSSLCIIIARCIIYIDIIHILGLVFIKNLSRFWWRMSYSLCFTISLNIISTFFFYA
jgi:hypothetical protein